MKRTPWIKKIKVDFAQVRAPDLGAILPPWPRHLSQSPPLTLNISTFY
jgi:hypothetical protein